MSGFKEHILGILRDNVLLHGEAMGFVLSDDTALLEHLQEKKFPVTDKITKPVFLFDYIAISEEYVTAASVLWALSMLSVGGIAVLDVSDWSNAVVVEYRSRFAGFTATPLNYGNKRYLVIHAGADYGN